MQFCTDHPGETVNFFCIKDESYICQKCLLEKHENHQFKSGKLAKQVASETQTKVDTFICSLNKLDDIIAKTIKRSNAFKIKYIELVSLSISKIETLLIELRKVFLKRVEDQHNDLNIQQVDFQLRKRDLKGKMHEFKKDLQNKQFLGTAQSTVLTEFELAVIEEQKKTKKLQVKNRSNKTFLVNTIEKRIKLLLSKL